MELDLLSLKFEPKNPATLGIWERIFRKVHKGKEDFTNSAAHQQLSHFHLEDYLDAPEKMRAMLDVVALALRTDSTRFVTLFCTGNNARALAGVEEAYHSLSHHGKNPEEDHSR